MAGVLNGAAFGSDVVNFTNDTTSQTNTGQCVMALDPVAFGKTDFGDRAKHVFDDMRAPTPLCGVTLRHWPQTIVWMNPSPD
jgi:LDH2 family malate/lactate/ureidoglycolate dehydrogenase